MKIDLHIHSAYSDGTFAPEQLVDTAIAVDLNVIAITDHDNILAHKIATDYVKEIDKKLEIVPGVEINTIHNGGEVHILGYFMDFENSDFQGLLKAQQQARIKQSKEMIVLLKKKEGINIKFEDIKKLVAEGGSIGRPHIARAITSAGGTGSVMEAYSKYINDSSPVYIPRKTVSPHEAVEIIYDAGGVPVLAHPIDLGAGFEKLAKELTNYGLRGLEAYHRKHSPAMVEYFSSSAEQLGLIITGGSDFHTPSANHGTILMGKNLVPAWVYDELMKEKRKVSLR
ncbi:PHP domain protein [Candidatus Gastranaerophilus sp. (ex Termes propinquus)]|nr:PHP domain protein [Candidatus Gastranaerophilus sp. (ex Termes propinquus)]